MQYQTWPDLEAALQSRKYEAVHGTTLDNLEDIQQIGLIGLLGIFVQEAYDEEIEMWMDHYGVDSIQELEHALGDRLVVFFGTPDNEGLHRTFSAILTHVGNKLNKRMHDVTPQDVNTHGLLVAFKSAEGLFMYDEDDYIYELVDIDKLAEEPDEVLLGHYSLERTIDSESLERPLGAEAGDLFTPTAGIPDAYVTGEPLVNLIRATGYDKFLRHW